MHSVVTKSLGAAAPAQRMITVDEALQRILELARPLSPRPLALDEALGRVLAEEVASDIDSPPYDKSLVDGYAVLASDLATGRAELQVLEQVTAGQVPTQRVSPGQSTRIMTGAPLPPGADAVVMIEETETRTSDAGRESVRIETSPPRPGQNLLPQAAAMRRGEVVLTPGRVLRACDIGVLCEVGRDPVIAHPAECRGAFDRR